MRAKEHTAMRINKYIISGVYYAADQIAAPSQMLGTKPTR